MSFSDLPNELVAEIFRHTLPDGDYSFARHVREYLESASTCRQHRAVALDVLRLHMTYVVDAGQLDRGNFCLFSIAVKSTVPNWGGPFVYGTPSRKYMTLFGKLGIELWQMWKLDKRTCGQFCSLKYKRGVGWSCSAHGSREDVDVDTVIDFKSLIQSGHQWKQVEIRGFFGEPAPENVRKEVHRRLAIPLPPSREKDIPIYATSTSREPGPST